MTGGILQADVADRGIHLDPRTKLFALFTLAIFVFGGLGGENVDIVLPVVSMTPFVLLLTARRWKQAIIGYLLYIGANLFIIYCLPKLTGIVLFILLGCASILGRFLPGILMGIYLMGTTTVSEFIAAMNRMHVSEKISIPLSVMFRFFPTVFEEAASIGTAMKMRDIRVGKRNAGKMLEYRLVPLMVCTVRIGEELSAAALTRGLYGDVRRTNICRIGFRAQDVIAILLCLVPWVMLVIGWFGINMKDVLS